MNAERTWMNLDQNSISETSPVKKKAQLKMNKTALV